MRPQTSDLRPQTSDLKPQTSDARPRTSDLRRQNSDLGPQTSDLGKKTACNPLTICACDGTNEHACLCTIYMMRLLKQFDKNESLKADNFLNIYKTS